MVCVCVTNIYYNIARLLRSDWSKTYELLPHMSGTLAHADVIQRALFSLHFQMERYQQRAHERDSRYNALSDWLKTYEIFPHMG